MENLKKLLDQLVEQACEKHHVPSIMVSVSKDGHTIYAGGGDADIKAQRNADEHTIYAIASVTKAFVATAICMLCDEGRLDLDTPIKHYIKDFEMYTPELTAALTSRDALSHKTGMARHDLSWFTRSEISPKEVVGFLKHLPPVYPFRYRMHYQNHMFVLGGWLIELVSGQSWHEFVKERILQPLGMHSTYFKSQDFLQLPNASRPYAYADGEIKELPFKDMFYVGAAGCICSTVADLAQWSAFQLTGCDQKGERIISQKMLEQLHNPQTIIKPGEMFAWSFPEVKFDSYGLGWFIESYRGAKLVHHGGTIDGYKSAVGFLPDLGVSFSVLTNCNRNQTPTVMMYSICDYLLGLEPIDWNQRIYDFLQEQAKQANETAEQQLAKLKTGERASSPLAVYQGSYTHPAYGTIILSETEGKLDCQLNAHSYELIPKCYDNFYFTGADVAPFLYEAAFTRDFNGEILSLDIAIEPSMTERFAFKKVNS